MEYLELQELFVEVKLGFSVFFLPNKGDIYLKHHNLEDRVFLKKRMDFFVSEAESFGIKKEKDFINFFISNGWWSSKKELFIKEQSLFIENLKKSKEKLVLESQKKQINDTIEEETIKLNEVLAERNSIMPITAETYAEKKYNRSYLHRSLYKDERFVFPFAENEDYFLEIDEHEYEFFWEKIYSIIQKFKLENIKYLAASAFFQNMLLVGGKNYSAYEFYGKPVVDLTVNQSDLFSFASFYRNYINNSTEKIPDYILNEPEQLINWCESGGSSRAGKVLSNKAPNKNKTKGERSGRISSVVGATAEDYSSLGIGVDKSVSLLSRAAKMGGEASIMDIVKATE